MTAKKTSAVAKAIPTKSEAKDTVLETVAIAAIPVAFAALQAGEMEMGIAIGVFGMALLVLKYKLRA